MSKKLILASLIASSLIISCSDERNEISITENSVLQKETSNKTSSNNNVSFPVTLIIGEESENNIGTNSTIEVNPNYPYYDDYNVYASDGNYTSPTPNCLNDGKPCINLSHFLGFKGAYSGNAAFNINSARFPVFYGENNYYSFNSYPLPANVPPHTYAQISSFSISENGSSSPLFNYSGYMTNDAANSVLHYFKDMIKTIPEDYLGRSPKIFAAHFEYGSWFTIPAERRIKMSVKYYYN